MLPPLCNRMGVVIHILRDRSQFPSAFPSSSHFTREVASRLVLALTQLALGCGGRDVSLGTAVPVISLLLTTVAAVRGLRYSVFVTLRIM